MPDSWVFPVINAVCCDEVWFHFYDAGEPQFEATDLLEFARAQRHSALTQP